MENCITCVILTQNSEKSLERTLKSLDGLPAIIIDGGSHDKTFEIAKRFQVRIIENPFKGFSLQRNFALDQVQSKWCLFIDSDEALTPELRQELIQITKLSQPKVLYRLMRTEYLLGEANEYGYGRSNYQERFFQTQRIRYTGDLHEYPIIDGIKPTFDHPLTENIDDNKRLLHNPDNNVSMMLDRIGKYVQLKADEKIKSGAQTNLISVLLIFPVSFLQIFLRRYKAGRIAFFEAMIKSTHRLLVKLLIYEHQILKKKNLK